MDRMTERAYKRKCFQGRGMVARSLDMAFFSLLGGACLYVLIRNLVFSTLLSAGLFLFFILWDRRRWHRYRQRIWQEADRSLRREAWLQQEAERIRGEGGVILYPTPDGERMIGLCLNFGQGTVFHSFGDTNNDLLATAEAYGCSVVFHPWQEGSLWQQTCRRSQLRARSLQRREGHFQEMPPEEFPQSSRPRAALRAPQRRSGSQRDA